MGLKSFNPYTASRRFITVVDKSHITKQEPEKALLEPKKRSGGRNNQGEIVIWHRGGGHKKAYRKVDFRREKVGVPAKVAAIEYDPNRSANLALLHYADREQRYILQPVGVKAGRTRWHGKKPTVRGVAMNPVDHPHGGGEGKVKGNHPQTPWAFPTLGKKTRHNKRTDKHIVERRK